jgi:hypothetical protein
MEDLIVKRLDARDVSENGLWVRALGPGSEELPLARLDSRLVPTYVAGSLEVVDARYDPALVALPRRILSNP